jgi:hypothetical protein
MKKLFALMIDASFCCPLRLAKATRHTILSSIPTRIYDQAARRTIWQ